MRKMPDPAELEPLLEKSAPPYRALRKRTEAAVVRWEWATDELYSLRPWYNEIHGFPRGKRLAAPPRKKGGNVEYGFDATDRVVVIRQHSDEFKGQYAEVFRAWDGGEVLEFQFARSPNYKDKPETVARYHFAEGRLLDYAGLSDEGGSEAEVYEYEGPRLVQIRLVMRPPVHKTAYRLQYAPTGGLVAIKDGRGNVVYKHRLPALPGLLEEMRDTLLRAIPAAVARHKVSEPAYCLALAYDSESSEGIVPPLVTLGLESDRREAMKGQTSPWDPQAFRSFAKADVELGGGRLLELGRDIALHFASSGKSEPGRRLLLEVCTKLNTLDWSRLLKVTDDFIVYPIDLEGADLARNMKAVVPARTLKALQKKGLL